MGVKVDRVQPPGSWGDLACRMKNASKRQWTHALPLRRRGPVRGNRKATVAVRRHDRLRLLGGSETRKVENNCCGELISFARINRGLVVPISASELLLRQFSGRLLVPWGINSGDSCVFSSLKRRTISRGASKRRLLITSQLLYWRFPRQYKCSNRDRMKRQWPKHVKSAARVRRSETR
ncbi:hypothetical protein Enr8_35830 [Blastopirellula retiformator]|uniref:Uncharacterized protein n=1 Tax=Blastopirellula retiformator TaxID=2527970 RepID=A0A5C5V0W9_9BACT|nr:hypothetical protein Enr8_35830 [Blastopirellula retiformator]